MRSKGREKSREGVLNTSKDKQTGEMTVDVTVLLSDYAKIRALARERGKRPMEVLKDIICGGVRHLAGVSSMALVATMVIFSSMPAHAGLFSSGAGDADGKPAAVRERQVGLFGPAKIESYKTSCEAHENLIEDCASLNRMIKEKEAHYSEISAELEQKYGMTLSQNYHYNSEDQTLYLVVTNGLFGSSPEKPVKRAHRAFIGEADAQGFLDRVAMRNAAAEDASVLRRFLKEKRMDLSSNEKELNDQYGVVQGKNYRLDEETGMFFEVLPLPTEAELKAMREAEKRAIREAEEQARIKAEAEKKAKAEAEARAEAERRAAKAQAEAERKAAKAQAEAERQAAKAKAEAEKRAKEEAERKARREREAAEARARAEKKRQEAELEARRKAEKEAEAARKRAEAEAEARAREERKAAERARKEAERAAELEKKRMEELRKEEEARARERAKALRKAEREASRY